MSVPAKRRPRSEVRRGRSHQALKPVLLNKCPKCGKALLSHHACNFCGYYKGKEVIKIKIKTKKESKK